MLALKICAVVAFNCTLDKAALREAVGEEFVWLLLSPAGAPGGGEGLCAPSTKSCTRPRLRRNFRASESALSRDTVYSYSYVLGRRLREN